MIPARPFAYALLACCLLMLGEPRRAVAGPTDARILGTYIQLLGFKVEAALVGRNSAYSIGVRNLAEHIAVDQVAARQMAYQVASDCRLEPVLPGPRTEAVSEQGQAISKLVGIKGRAFDDAYLSHEIVSHKDAIAAIGSEWLPAATCAKLKAHLKSALPVLEAHLEQAARLAKGG